MKQLKRISISDGNEIHYVISRDGNGVKCEKYAYTYKGEVRSDKKKRVNESYHPSYWTAIIRIAQDYSAEWADDDVLDEYGRTLEIIKALVDNYVMQFRKGSMI